MKKPSIIPLTNHPRSKQITQIPLVANEEVLIDNEPWQVFDIAGGPPILAKKNENNLENNSESVSKLESD